MRNQLCTICLAWGPEVAKHNRVPSLDCDGHRNLSLARLARKNLMPQSGVPGRYRPKEARGHSVSWGQIALFCCLFDCEKAGISESESAQVAVARPAR